MLNTFALSIFIPDPFSVATIETGDLIPSDVYQSLNESLELKCLLNAHIEKINEVKSKITIFSWCFFFQFYYVKVLCDNLLFIRNWFFHARFSVDQMKIFHCK